MTRMATHIFIESVSVPENPFFQDKGFELIRAVEQRYPRRYRTQRRIVACRARAALLLLQGLYEVYCAELHGMPVVKAPLVELLVPRHVTAYGQAPLKELSHTVVIELLDSLVSMGWIEQRRGYFAGNAHYRTAIRPKGELLEKFRSHGYRWQPSKIDKSKEVIIVRNYDPRTGKKYQVPTPETPAVRAMRKNLYRINQALRDSLICLDCDNYSLYRIKQRLASRARRRGFDVDAVAGGTSLRFEQVDLYRVFSRNDLSLGGRLYGSWWQLLPSEFRRFITINGEPTVEIDFATFHPRLLFMEAGIPIPDVDIYTKGLDLPEEMTKERRSLVKKAFNAWICDEGGFFRLTKKEERLLGMTTNQLRKKFIKRYPPLKDFFGTGRGLSFQAKDATACELILSRLLDQGVVALAIHDSFRVQTRHHDKLVQAMRWAYTEVFGGEAALSDADFPLTDFETSVLPGGATDFHYLRRTHEQSVCLQFGLGYFAYQGALIGQKAPGGGPHTR